MTDFYSTGKFSGFSSKKSTNEDYTHHSSFAPQESSQKLMSFGGNSHRHNQSIVSKGKQFTFGANSIDSSQRPAQPQGFEEVAKNSQTTYLKKANTFNDELNGSYQSQMIKMKGERKKSFDLTPILEAKQSKQSVFKQTASYSILDQNQQQEMKSSPWCFCITKK